MAGRWAILRSAAYANWFDDLAVEQQDAIIAVALRLQIDGPALRRPLSGQIQGSRFKNMKELIPPRGRVVRHEHSDRGRDLRATPRE